MFRTRKTRNSFDIWPAYVDILATVLMVLIFVLMTFVLSQIYLSDSIVGKDSVIESLNTKLTSLDQNLDLEKKRLKDAHIKLKKMEDDLSLELDISQKLSEDKKDLKNKLENMFNELKKVSDLLDEEATVNKKDKITISDLNKGIEKLAQELEAIKQQNIKLEEENGTHKELTRVHAYRSEFFTKLKLAIGDMDNMQVVGDRFIFQSELLFAPGSTDLGDVGQGKLEKLSNTLKEITKKIPKNINWVLRVDGHTDNVPIRHAFASNWELSAARAISVVKFLMKQGINPKNLVAAGFGQFQPLIKGSNEKARSKNRRIEFKLDQR
ncbi:MAG: hypothetical protein COY39_04500 [Alphaproteobacteria bacterium CG_4_10_14_0_8_um_filter_37_21]|nr:MAG: hypothetical protein COY39_04500 [Alphaproteobacteria bacterium CG_4_10_14_0_8_um_filter_37_21]